MRRSAWLLGLLCSVGMAMAQVRDIQPEVLTKSGPEGRVTEVEVAAHFVTAIHMPEPVNSVVVGDPELFEVEHSDKEPRLVFIKAVTTKPAETNLLISTTYGHEASLLVISRGESQPRPSVDFLVRYKTAGEFLVQPSVYPSALIGETLVAGQPAPVSLPDSFSTNPPSAVHAGLTLPSRSSQGSS